ncbi:hypothetical protein FDW89_01065 [Citrobacter sp. wls830]|nr:hypothetical protein FDW89_01065 [Citrobacter sp. wls830]TKV15533.1 hypothetical protein FDX04_08465 [Citrobacter sp. wls615]
MIIPGGRQFILTVPLVYQINTQYKHCVFIQIKASNNYELVCQCQIKTLRNNIVDDDQGIFIMCYHFKPQLIKLNHLGKNRWFNFFKLYGRNDFVSFSRRLKVTLIGK